ncbi:MAG: ABC transporter ATP-binding protein [Flavobacteriaceae bacterium]
MSRLEIESLRIAYGKAVAVGNLSLTVEHGELVSLLGPSGSGKTSVLRAVGGYLKPTSGAIRIDGKDITRLPPQFRDMGMVFQNFVLFPHMSALDNVEFGLRTRGVARDERRSRAVDALKMVEMDRFLDRLPFQLSGGQQQRVALARAIVIRPTVLLMDEPMGALDAKLRAQAQEEIRALQQELGLTAILVTHDQQEAMSMSDRIVVMRDGDIMDEGDPARLYREPRDAFTAEFLGTTSLLPVEVVGSGKQARVRVAGSRYEFIANGERPDSGIGYVSLRPEDIRCSRKPVAGSVPGRVSKRIFHGVNTFLRIEAPDVGSLLALEGRDSSLGEGDRVHVSWQRQDARLLPRDAA